MKNMAEETDKKKVPVIKTSLETLKNDYDLMLDYAVKKGIRLPKQIILDNSDLGNDEIVTFYNDLAGAIEPATVDSINFINNNIFYKNDYKHWYQIHGYSRSLIIGLFALISVICVSLSEKVNNESLSESVLDCSGIELLFILIFICSSSLLGVMFYVLKTMNQKIKSYTLTQGDILVLNSTILIGVISGFLFSEVFSGFIDSTEFSMEITKMTLAVLGGFSSDTLFSILQDVLKKMKNLFTSVK